jgi:hypothetical protein
VALGIVAGLAHRTKSSALPGLVVFLLVAGGCAVWSAVQTHYATEPGARRAGLLRQALYLGLVILYFLLTIFPYIKNSWYRFGRPFYDVNSTFYVWYDSWAQIEEGTKAHGDRRGRPEMPASNIPSLQKYLREHDLTLIAQRLGRGAGLTYRVALDSYGYAGYVLLVGVGLAAGSIISRRRLMDGIRLQPGLAGFLLLYFVVQFVAFAWFAEMVDGNRLVLALFLPLLVVFALGMRYLFDVRSVDRASGKAGGGGVALRCDAGRPGD